MTIEGVTETANSPRNLYVAIVPVLDDSQPNFRPAAWRAVEAGMRLREIQQLMPDLAKEWKGYPVARAPKISPHEIQLSLAEWSWSQMPTARMLTHLASEVLHHARIALDYCAYHVVWLDSGKKRDHTKFPLVVRPDKWSSERRNSLPGITPEHTARIREVQPFLDVEWSANLVSLSNRDKHRMAVDVIPTYRCRVNQERIYSDPLGDPTFLGFAVDEARLELNIAPSMDQNSRPNKSLPLDVTLAGIVQGVINLVNSFLGEAGYSAISLNFADPVPTSPSSGLGA